MQDAGLIHYSSNARVYITFELLAARVRAEVAPQSAGIARGVALPETGDQPERAEVARQSAEIARTRAEVARSDTPPVGKDLTTGTAGRKEGSTYLPAVEGVQGEQPTDQPLTDQERSIDLLTDSAVGCTDDFAEKLAAAYPFEQIRLQVFQALRQMKGPKPTVKSIGIIESRLKINFAATVTDADRASDLWRRHETEDEAHDERVRKYCPAEYAHIIIS